jgi:selenoprotein W-related protein
LTSRLLEALKQKIASFTLIPAGGGCFELTVGGELVYSKLETGEFPDENWVLDQLRLRTKQPV